MTRATGAPAAPQPASEARRATLETLRGRRSHSRVTEQAPSSAELAELVSAMSAVADHSGLRPWRLIEIRGDRRRILGEALAEAAGETTPEGEERYLGKAQRAPLVLAVVVCERESEKVPRWEQEAVAAGVAHYLGLLLHEAGWGSMWRTGVLARSAPLRRAHRLAKNEELMGWLYIGGIAEGQQRDKPRRPLDPAEHLSSL
ncbi:nitroreductase family protein [Leucobacter sp. CSA1]|uniref:Putative NAD(P)H nitroreductase n=1 Tax=Leucobacter chromiisoli TaxID=2796471 RepID=A0A934Q6Z8_9MICO|nr:nitroreductase family protein [Leucobacter chromiisoli]MBK0417712.1 nitroreductase family protein [Leucobacter chromiisoli]